MAATVAASGRFPVSRVAEIIGVSRSQLNARLAGTAEPRKTYRIAGDADLLPATQRIVDERPTYGYRRIAGLA